MEITLSSRFSIARIRLAIGEGILGFFTMKDSNALRGVCKEFREAVMDFPWMDADSKIYGSLRVWRAAFPAARAVNISTRPFLVDSDFVHIRGDARARLHTVSTRKCSRVTDVAMYTYTGYRSST